MQSHFSQFIDVSFVCSFFPFSDRFCVFPISIASKNDLLFGRWCTIYYQLKAKYRELKSERWKATWTIFMSKWKVFRVVWDFTLFGNLTERKRAFVFFFYSSFQVQWAYSIRSDAVCTWEIRVIGSTGFYFLVAFVWCFSRILRSFCIIWCVCLSASRPFGYHLPVYYAIDLISSPFLDFRRLRKCSDTQDTILNPYSTPIAFFYDALDSIRHLSFLFTDHSIWFCELPRSAAFIVAPTTKIFRTFLRTFEHCLDNVIFIGCSVLDESL